MANIEDIRLNDVIPEQLHHRTVGNEQRLARTDTSFTLQYKSAMAVGKAELVTDRNEKIEALRAICLRFLPHHMNALPYGRACSRSEEPMQASLSSRSITAFDDAIARSLERTAVVKITLTEPPTGKRKQYDKQGEEMKWGRME